MKVETFVGIPHNFRTRFINEVKSKNIPSDINEIYQRVLSYFDVSTLKEEGRARKLQHHREVYYALVFEILDEGVKERSKFYRSISNIVGRNRETVYHSYKNYLNQNFLFNSNLIDGKSATFHFCNLYKDLTGVDKFKAHRNKYRRYNQGFDRLGIYLRRNREKALEEIRRGKPISYLSDSFGYKSETSFKRTCKQDYPALWRLIKYYSY
jgi:hypothetical protein